MPNFPVNSYPDQAIGAMAAIKPLSWLSLKSGWYDGDAKGGTSGFSAFSGKDSALLMDEAKINYNIKNYPGTFLTGYWLKTKHTDELANGNNYRIFGQTMGWYAEGEQMIRKENKNPSDDQGLTIFDQFSQAPSDRSIVSRYYGTGLSYKGLIPNRDKDILGISTAIAQLSGRLKNINGDGRYGARIHR